MQHLEGFFNDEPAGDWLEIVCLWRGSVWDVRHQPQAGAPEAWVSLAVTGGGFSDSQTQMTYWFREVEQPVAVASDPRAMIGGLTMAAFTPFFLGVMFIVISLLTGSAGDDGTRMIAFGMDYEPHAVQQYRGRAPELPKNSGSATRASSSVSSTAPAPTSTDVRAAGMLGALTAIHMDTPWALNEGLSRELDTALSDLMTTGGDTVTGGRTPSAGLSGFGHMAGATCDGCPSNMLRRGHGRPGSLVGGDGTTSGGPGDALIEIADDEAVVVGYDKRIISEVIRKHHPAILYCYERKLRREEFLGRVSVSFSIGNTGSVTIARVSSSTIRDDQLHDCVVDVFKRMRFPPPRHTVVVNYPIFFKPTG